MPKPVDFGSRRSCRGMNVCTSLNWRGPWTLLKDKSLMRYPQWYRLHTNGVIHWGPSVYYGDETPQ